MSGFLEQGIAQGKAKKASNIKHIAGFLQRSTCVIFLKKDAIHELIEVPLTVQK